MGSKKGAFCARARGCLKVFNSVKLTHLSLAVGEDLARAKLEGHAETKI